MHGFGFGSNVNHPHHWPSPTCSNFNPSFNSPLLRSFLRNKLGLYRDAIGAAYHAISILRLFPADSIFNGFFWWGEDRNPHDAIGTLPLL